MWDWDEAKREANRTKHGLDFAALAGFDWPTAQVEPDLRRDYGEERLNAFGLIGDRLHVVTYTMRGPTYRAISLRKANYREYLRWISRET